jgi:predicted alpha-1,2-mannosidase
MKKLPCILLALSSLFLTLPLTAAKKDFTKYVDPKIGNVSQLLVPTYPTFSLPNQMLRMIPVKPDYIADQVAAWPLQVEAHREKGLMQMRVSLGEVTNSTWKRKMSIDHDLEVVRPWLYSTYLIKDDITVSFTPSAKSAIYKIEFPAKTNKNILISGSDKMIVNVAGENTFTLHETISYRVRGIEPTMRYMSVYCYAELTDAKGNALKEVKLTPQKDKISITSNSANQETIQLKYAISYISFEQAKKNFDIEIANQNFDQTATKGKLAGDKVINQIEVAGGTEAQKRSFYTALYRTYERMVDVNEYGQFYSGYDGKVHKSERPFYVDDWVWDSYLAKHPINAFLNPTMQSDQLNSYVLMYEHSGWMPTFPQVHGNHLCMNAYHSASLFIDAYRKDIKGFDMEKAYEGIKKNLTEATFLPWRQGHRKVGLDDFYHTHGYYPALHPGQEETEPLVDAFEKRQSVATSLGISYDAWALAQMAKEMNKTDDYKRFSDMSDNYKKLWHCEMQLFMPKDEKGEWIMIDPKLDGGPGFRDYYDENNGWTYAWWVQHDIDGLIDLLGGKQKAEARLDQLFREPLGVSKQEYLFNAPDATGQVGQYVMGNEPSLHIPYLYNYFGSPWKTQKRIRFLLDVWFKDNIFGIPGDEDGGGLSAFVVFSSLGFYPVTPGLPVYTIGSPLFEKSTINLPNNKTFTVIAKGASATNKYIQKAFLNGKEINTTFFSHKELMDGGTLQLIMGSKPNKQWGVN